MSGITVNNNPVTTPPPGPTLGGSNTLPMPWDPNGTSPSYQINWNLPPDQIVQEIEQQYEQLITWLQNNPNNMYNGGLTLLQMTLEIGQNMGSLPAADQQELTAFMNNQLSGSGNSTLMGLIVQMAVQGEAVQNGQAAADAFVNQLTSELQGMTGFGSTFNTMYQAAMSMSINNDSPINNWISQNYITYTDPVTGKTTQGWINPQTGQPFANYSFSNYANTLAFPIGTLMMGSNTTQYINSLYSSEIAQIFASTTNPWERLMMLLAEVEDRMGDQGQQMNGLSNNLNTLSQANNDVADMQNMIKNPTAANMQQFYSDFNNLKSLIELNPSLSSLSSDLNDVSDIFNGNTVPFPATSVAANGTYLLPTDGTLVEFTPTGSTTPEFLSWDSSKGVIDIYSKPGGPIVNTVKPSGSTPGLYSSSTGGTVSVPFTPWSVGPGMYSLPENVVIEYTPTGATSPTYMEWNGTDILTSSSSNMANPTSTPCSSGEAYLSGGTMTISPLDNPNLTSGFTYGQLQGLGDYQDIASSLVAAQANYSSPVSSNNANTLTSLQTYFNSVAQPTQQEYSTDSSSYQTEMSAFAQFLQAPITQEQTMTTAMASANS